MIPRKVSSDQVFFEGVVMSNGISIDGDVFKILKNEEDQYSIWPADLDVPAGWAVTGPTGDKETVTAWIDEHWTDMRPRSLREAMDGETAVSA